MPFMSLTRTCAYDSECYTLRFAGLGHASICPDQRVYDMDDAHNVNWYVFKVTYGVYKWS